MPLRLFGRSVRSENARESLHSEILPLSPISIRNVVFARKIKAAWTPRVYNPQSYFNATKHTRYRTILITA